MRKFITILVLLAVGAGGYYYYRSTQPLEEPQVVQTSASLGTIVEEVQATGTLEALRTVTVGPQVSGTIEWLGADFNSMVRAGQVVARLDPSLLQVQVDIRTATIERQETDIASQRIQLEDAVRNVARTKELFEKGLSNETQLEQADLTVKTRTAQIASAEKSLVQAQANLAQANLNLSYTEVKSPIDGVVVDRLVDVGQTVQSRMNVVPFFVIATDLRTLRLSAGVDEAEIGKIRAGMKVAFTVDSYMPQVFEGTVSSVRLNATTQSNVVTYPVWIDASNPDLKLRPSMTASARIVVSTAEDAVRVPRQALRFRPTTDIYNALGLTPPAAAAGGGAPQAQAFGGRGQARGDGREGGGRGRGRGDVASRSPEERQRAMRQFGGVGAGRGRPRPTRTAATLAPLTAAKIDELFQPAPPRLVAGQVWAWDEASRTLTAVRVRTGVSDSQFSQLIEGNVTPGQMLVTSVIIPQTTAQRTQDLFGGQQKRGFGGMPGGGGGGGHGH